MWRICSVIVATRTTDLTTLPLAGNPTDYQVANQTVAGYATRDFYIGSLGVSPQPELFTTFNDAYPSLLTTLRNQNLIPSSSWGYTAGAYYQAPKVYGSLTLGGYDQTRFIPNNVSITFGADSSRDLLVGIQQITSDTLSSPFLSFGIYAFIDSMVPHIWLPISVCTAFERAFNHTWNDTAELYLLTEDEHTKLLNMNANITIRLGPNAASSSNESVNIVMPYGAFDLTASLPLVESPTYYFPLKRAQNDTQYTLGRVFLQQAYIIADYDRSNFSVSQALFPGISIKKNIIATLAPGTPSEQNHGTLSKKVIVSIPCSIILLLLVIAFLNRWHRRSQSPQPPVEAEKHDRDKPFEKAELDHTITQVAQLDNPPIPELDTTEIMELSTDKACQLEVLEGNSSEKPEAERSDILYLANRRQELVADWSHGSGPISPVADKRIAI